MRLSLNAAVISSRTPRIGESSIERSSPTFPCCAMMHVLTWMWRLKLQEVLHWCLSTRLGEKRQQMSELFPFCIKSFTSPIFFPQCPFNNERIVRVSTPAIQAVRISKKPMSHEQGYFHVFHKDINLFCRRPQYLDCQSILLLYFLKFALQVSKMNLKFWIKCKKLPGIPPFLSSYSNSSSNHLSSPLHKTEIWRKHTPPDPSPLLWPAQEFTALGSALLHPERLEL